jgi:hypothetical protein
LFLTAKVFEIQSFIDRIDKEKARHLSRDTRFLIFDFTQNPESLVRNLDLHHKLFKVSKSRLETNYFLIR